LTGLTGRTTTATNSSTTDESGSSASTTYSHIQTAGNTVTTSELSNFITGDYTLTSDGDSQSSLHAEGWEGTANEYTLDKTDRIVANLGLHVAPERGQHLAVMEGNRGDPHTAKNSPFLVFNFINWTSFSGKCIRPPSRDY